MTDKLIRETSILDKDKSIEENKQKEISNAFDLPINVDIEKDDKSRSSLSIDAPSQIQKSDDANAND